MNERPMVMVPRGPRPSAPVVSETAPDIVDRILKTVVDNAVSDVHLDPQEGHLRVRFRTDGVLEDIESFGSEISKSIVSRIKIVANMNVAENRRSQDGRFSLTISGRKIDFRVAIMPIYTYQGEKVTIRVLDPKMGEKSFEELGLFGHNLDKMREITGMDHGMVLVTGPTGSGKTTTLYAMLRAFNTPEVNAVSIEDPVEYLVSGVNQAQVKPETDFTFANALSDIVRHDPDIIMVGEIRDSETAGLAVQAAMTGHIVLTSLHTNNAAGVIPRLVDMKVDRYALSSSVNYMIAQRLVRRLCEHCKREEKPDVTTRKMIKDTLAGVDRVHSVPTIWRAPGCELCKGHGTRGRVAIFEIFEMTPEVQAIIASGAMPSEIKKEAERQGMVSLRQDGFLRALSGVVSLEEVRAITSG